MKNFEYDELDKVFAHDLLEDYVSAYRSMCNRLGDIHIMSPKPEFQVSNLQKWAELLDIEVIIEDWVGNEHCKTDWNEAYFIYDGIRFCQLIEKEESIDE